MSVSYTHLFICFHSFANPGGVKNHILGLSKEFEKRGIETKIIIPRRKLRENYGNKVIIKMCIRDRSNISN